MALFKRDFNKPGPGVPKNAPRKRGFARYFEIVGRDLGNLVKLNFLFMLCILPAIICFVVAVFSWGLGASAMFFLFAVLALGCSVLVGPATTALYNIMTKMLRDEPGFIWHNFKKVFKDNFRCTVVPGVVYSLLVGSQVLAALIFFASGGQINMVITVLYLFGIIIFNLAAPYFFLQASYLDLGAMGIAKNSLLFALGYLPRTFAGMIISGIFILGQIAAMLILPVLFPFILIITLTVGVTLPLLCQVMWYWPQLDKTFNIDKTLKERTATSIDESLGDDAPREPLE